MNIESIEKIKMELDALPDLKSGPHFNERQWSKEEDELLLLYWPVKHHEQVAKALGVSSQTALKRYRFLTGK